MRRRRGFAFLGDATGREKHDGAGSVHSLPGEHVNLPVESSSSSIFPFLSLITTKAVCVFPMASSNAGRVSISVRNRPV